MGFQDDWMMRQIEMMTRFVANVIFKRNDTDVHYEIIGNVDDSTTLTRTDLLFLKLQQMILEGRLCEAENELYDNMEYSDKYIELSTDFYKRLNDMSDQQLIEGGFSRDEVYDGYIEIMSLLGVPIDVFGQGDRTDYME